MVCHEKRQGLKGEESGDYPLKKFIVAWTFLLDYVEA